ncbi:MAG: hypothetical protein NTX85_03295 [Candidatus Nomurabacteria bacterium]|nr:hypothetical protein [Candidatus Nomurabacteria bacterium]MCX6788444.1 hypothetical protein [Candidatus Jorgensenbacteria bacterium]
MERTTKTLQTPLRKEIVLKEYVTARERNELRSILLGNMKFDTEGKEIGTAELSGNTLEISERKMLEVIVTSYDGSTENIIDRLLDSTPEEYDFAVKEAMEVNKGNLIAAK